jgi:hypothetical protein
MLLKIQTLFNRHPNTKHEIILDYTSRSKLRGGDTSPEPDPKFEKDLDDNPDIAEYIRKNFFNLETRLQFTTDVDKSLESFQDQIEIACPKCDSYLVVPNAFYSMVGNYQDKIDLERSRNPRFWATTFRNSKNI